MAARHLALLGLALLALLPLPSNAEFLNDDLVFEESVSPPRWRTATNPKLVHSRETNSIETNNPALQHHSDSDSNRDSGLWAGAVNVLHRIKRGWLDWSLLDSSKESSETTISTTDSEITDSKEQKETTVPLSRTTRDTKNPDDDAETVSLFGAGGENDASLRDDDDYLVGTSGGGSGSDTTLDGDLTSENFIPHSTTNPSSPQNRVYYRVTMEVNEPFHEAFSNTRSREFTEFSQNFSEAVDELLKDVQGIHKTGVVNVEPTKDNFFSKVTVDISSEGNSDEDSVKSVLEDNVNNLRSIGQYTLNPVLVFRKFLAPGPFSPQPGDYCPPGDIRCQTILDEYCLPVTARCNGTSECLDESDELGCPTEPPTTTTSTTTPSTTTTTTEDTFAIDITTPGIVSVRANVTGTSDRCRADDSVRCADGSTLICVDQKCDGKPDCPGGDDELNCPPEYECESDQFMCDGSRCIDRSQRCDGVDDCNDRSDEQGCSPGKISLHTNIHLLLQCINLPTKM